MLPEFIRYLEAERRYSPLTVRNYRRDIERFMAWLDCDDASFDPRSVTTDQVREWIIDRTEQGGIGAASMNREVSSLRTLFRWLLRTGAVTHDVMRPIASLRTPHRLPAFVPEPHEGHRRGSANATAETSPPNATALIVLMLYACGLRLAELVGIDRDDLSDDAMSLRVRGKGRQRADGPRTGARPRKKILRYLDLIKRQNICDSGEKALFLTRKGERISRTAVYRTVRREWSATECRARKSPTSCGTRSPRT